MATISARVEDNVKTQAEEIADEIGIPLSTAVNIFLKRFVSSKGFPFDVTIPENNIPCIINETELTSAFSQAVKDTSFNGQINSFTYLDPKTGKLVTMNGGN